MHPLAKQAVLHMGYIYIYNICISIYTCMYVPYLSPYVTLLRQNTLLYSFIYASISQNPFRNSYRLTVTYSLLK